MVNEKTVIGFYEDVIIHGKKIRAKVDSGAGVSSIDYDLAKKLKVGPFVSVPVRFEDDISCQEVPLS